MLPSLQARESIDRVNEMSYAGATMEPKAAKQWIRDKEFVADRHRGRRNVYRPTSMEDMQRLMGDSKTQIALESFPAA